MSPPGADQHAAAVFHPLRPILTRVAYRMLGSVADAEDVVQDAFLRWLHIDREGVREPAAFLRRVVTHLCMDRLRSARRERQSYIGQWLPEPVVEPAAEMSDDVTLPLLMALERLSPLERAAFLLHDVFGLGFEEIAATIDREPSACRQLASRARAHVRADRPRYAVPKDQGLSMAEAFFAASRAGDMKSLRTLLATDVTLWSDGGGKAPARRAPAVGLEDVMRAFASFAPVYASSGSLLLRYGLINGLPGFVTLERGDILQTTALEIAHETHDTHKTVVGIYVMRNPDKLRHIPDTAQ